MRFCFQKQMVPLCFRHLSWSELNFQFFFRGHFVAQIIFLNLKATLDTVKTLASYLLPEAKHTTKWNFVLTELFVR